MIFRQLDGTGDWTFGKGISGYATQEQAVELNILTRLQSWKGDCFFAAEDYVDWFGRLDKNQQSNLEQELKNVILNSFGVVSVDEVSVTLSRITRAIIITYSAQTIYGTSFQNQISLAGGTLN